MEESTQAGGVSTQVVVVQQTNGIGLAGFIVSLVGVASCGALAPIGLILSLIGLGKQPRGFAIAGTIIGGLGTLFFALFGLVFILAILGLSAAGLSIGEMATHGVIAGAEAEIDQERANMGALPSDADGKALISGMSDMWGVGLRYELIDEDNYLITSAGPDMAFDTEDDLTSDDEIGEEDGMDDGEPDLGDPIDPVEGGGDDGGGG